MIAPKDELTALLTLGKSNRLDSTKARLLYEETGSALGIFSEYRNLNDILPGVTQCLDEVLNDPGLNFAVGNEIEFIKQNRIRCLTMKDADYPARLKECPDAPLLLFGLGKFNLNPRHTVAVVGTRNATLYGKELAARFVRDLISICPDTLIISGLAYGIDVCAHNSAVDYGAATVGVLAHGLDKIYPPAHREIAKRMLADGGLITEFMHGQIPFKRNFVRRNRIVAGMADAVVVVESAKKGGSLITAEIAESYSRSCFAFPGSVGDVNSEGCNNLIRSNRAGLIQSAQDFAEDMGWTSGRKVNGPVQKELFSDLSPAGKQILECLEKAPKGLELNILVVKCNMNAGDMISLLFDLEMKGLVKSHPGCVYTICR